MTSTVVLKSRLLTPLGYMDVYVFQLGNAELATHARFDAKHTVAECLHGTRGRYVCHRLTDGIYFMF